MKRFLQSHSPIKHAKSFKYAFDGIGHALIMEANFRVQILILFIEIVLGYYFKITKVEWGLLTISMSLLLSAEMFNTVVERFIDHLIPQKNDAAKIIKDLSAGFVLLSAFSAGIIFLLVFGDRLPTILTY